MMTISALILALSSNLLLSSFWILSLSSSSYWTAIFFLFSLKRSFDCSIVSGGLAPGPGFAPDEAPVLAAEVPELAPDLEGLATEAPALEADAVLE